MKPTLMVDLRCPKCNQPVVGGLDVTWLKALPVVKSCQHCQAAVEVVPGDDLGQPDLQGRNFTIDTPFTPKRRAKK
jgi:hypothetical protein